MILKTSVIVSSVEVAIPAIFQVIKTKWMLYSKGMHIFPLIQQSASERVIR